MNSCGRLKPDIFEVHYVKNSGPVLNETFKFKMVYDNVCLQLCWLLSPGLLHALKSIFLSWRQQSAILKEDLVSSRLCNILVAGEEGV